METGNPQTHPQTGPTSTTAKSRPSDNATTHGGTSQKLIVAGEQQEDFTNLLSGLLAEYSPVTTSAHLLVEDFAHAQWFLWRRIRASNSAEHAPTKPSPTPPSGPTPRSTPSPAWSATAPQPNAASNAPSAIWNTSATPSSLNPIATHASSISKRASPSTLNASLSS